MDRTGRREMEGSAISRSVNGPMKINQSKDPDMDGNSMIHPGSQNIVKNAQKQVSQRLGRDSFIDSDPKKSGSKIRGGQNA